MLPPASRRVRRGGTRSSAGDRRGREPTDRTAYNEVVRAHNQEDLIRAVMAEGVRDPRLLQALREVPRSAFVPADLAAQAYLDQPLPIPHGQVTTQPSLWPK